MAAYALANAWSDVNTIIANSEDAWIQNYETKVNTRKDLLEDQLEQGLINQEYYNHQVEALDEDLDKKKAEITLKQAKREKSCRHIQCNHQYCRRNRSFLVKGIAFSMIIGAAGALQIAAIASTPLPQTEGYEQGGFIDVARAQDNKRFRARHNPKKRGWITQPTVLTGEKPGSREYVIPDEAMDNPSIAPLIEMLEMARISHNLKTVDLSTAIPAMPGRQSGGFLYQQPQSPVNKQSTNNNQQNSTNEPLTHLSSAINLLNNILAKGQIRAKVIYQDFEEMENKVNKITNESKL